MHLNIFFMKSNTLVIIAILIFLPTSNAERALRRRARACPKIEIPNAELSYKSNFKILRVNCAPGYVLYGGNYVLCEMGKWNAALPVCAKGGCLDIENSLNGVIMYNQHQQAHLYCRGNYKLAGGRVAYCNGTAWDRPLGTCRESTDKVQLSCDFETEDLCGWTHDDTHDFDWKRIMAANIFSKLRTGPQYDHTTLTANSGHYMLMESFDQVSSSVARLVSPIYSKNLTENSACFRFYYFMYGATVGNLSVYVRPLSVSSETSVQVKNNQIKSTYRQFLKSGNQKNIWNEGQFIIEEMSEDFQVIIEGTTGTNHLSDIAIDDVQLMTYAECNGDQTSISTAVPEVTDYAIYDVQSCEGRCGETNTTHYGITEKNGKFYKNCDCHSECEDLKTCCPNYQLVCELGTLESSTQISDTRTTLNLVKRSSMSTVSTMTVTKSTTTTTAATTTPTTTTTKIIPTTTVPTLSTSSSTTTTVATKRSTSSSTSTLTTASSTKKLKITQSPTPSTNSTTAKTTTIILSTTVLSTPEITTMSRIKPIASTKSPDLITMPSIAKNLTSNSEHAIVIDDVKPKASIQGPISNAEKREKIISWEVAHGKQPISKSPSWLIFTATIIGIAIIAAIGVILRFHRTCRRIRIYKRGNANCDTTTLLYSQGDELIIES